MLGFSGNKTPLPRQSTEACLLPSADGDVAGSANTGSTPRDAKAAAKDLQASANRLSKELSGSSSTSAADPGAPKTDEQLIVAVDQANAELEKQVRH